MYDYIVVGAGSAGSVVAGELSSDPSLRVLVLESGDPADRNPETLEAAGYKKAFINDRLMWERFSTPQTECANHRLFVGTGRGAGGSGSINAMVYTRGSAFDYASWNADGWRWSDVVPAFERLEQKLGISRKPPTRFTETCIAAACESGFQRKEDLNDGTLSGFLGYEWMNIRGEDRRSSYVAFLRPNEKQPNVTFLTGATVHRVVFDAQRRAIGVEYEVDGRRTLEKAAREVILSAGALETPKLLMLSGLGPADELRRHGIPLVHENSAIGRNLMDHPNVSLFYKGREPTDCNWAQLYGFHRANPDSSLPTGEADTCYVFYSARSSFREGVMRMLPGMALPQNIYQLGWPPSLMRRAIAGVFAVPALARFVEKMYGIVVILGKPKSRGTVRLASSNARDHAAVDPNYFGVSEDLDTLVQGVHLARRVADAPSLKEWGNFELIPGRRTDARDAIASFIRKNVMTTYHFAGTCKLGDGNDAVVDQRLRVRGVTGLRVADASVIPSVPVSAMNAPSMMIGWRAAQFVTEDRAKSAS
jgi:choline dehydrogenase